MAEDSRWTLVEDAQVNLRFEVQCMIHHPNLNILIILTKASELLILDLNTLSILHKIRLSAPDNHQVTSVFLEETQKVLFSNGKTLGLRNQYKGVFLLETILEPPLEKPQDTAKLEVLLSEAVLLQKALNSTHLPGIEYVDEVTGLLSKKIEECQVDLKKSKKALKWSIICLELPHYKLKTVFGALVEELNLHKETIPVMPIASAVNERLNWLLPTSIASTDRTLMCSEATRAVTFVDRPHMDYRWALPDDMAAAGFYQHSADDDRVICFACSIILNYWQPSERPWEEHLRFSPDCPFVNGHYTSNVPASVAYATAPGINMESSQEVLELISTTSVAEYIATASRHGHVVVWNVKNNLKKEASFYIVLPAFMAAVIAKGFYDESSSFYSSTLKNILLYTVTDSNVHSKQEFEALCKNLYQLELTAVSVVAGSKHPNLHISSLNTPKSEENLRRSIQPCIVGGISVKPSTSLTSQTDEDLHASESAVAKAVNKLKSATSFKKSNFSESEPQRMIRSVPEVHCTKLLSLVVYGIANQNQSHSHAVPEQPDFFSELMLSPLMHPPVEEKDPLGEDGEYDEDEMIHGLEFTPSSGGLHPTSENTACGSFSSSMSSYDFLHVQYSGGINQLPTSQVQSQNSSNLVEMCSEPEPVIPPTSIDSAKCQNAVSNPKEIGAKPLECILLPDYLNKNDLYISGIHPTKDGNHLLVIVDTVDHDGIVSCKSNSSIPEMHSSNEDLAGTQCKENAGRISYTVEDIYELVEDAYEQEFVVIETPDDYNLKSTTSSTKYGAILIYSLKFDGDVVGVNDNPVKVLEFGSIGECPMKVILLPLYERDYIYESDSLLGSREDYPLGLALFVCRDGSARILDVSTLKVVAVAENNGMKFVSAAYCNDLGSICLCTNTGSLHIFPLGTEKAEGSSSDESSVRNEVKKDSDLSGGEGFNHGDYNPAGTQLLGLTELKNLHELIEYENGAPVFFVNAPVCWVETLHSHMKKFLLVQKKEDFHYTKSWRLQPDENSWNEHLFEVIVQEACVIGHIDIMFSLDSTCHEIPDIEVSLLTRGPGIRKKDVVNRSENNPGEDPFESSCFSTYEPEGSSDMEGEILCGPVKISSCLDTSEFSGIVTLTSPKLLRYKGRWLIVRVKSVADYKLEASKHYEHRPSTKRKMHENNEHPSDREKPKLLKGCDWLCNISISLRKPRRIYSYDERNRLCSMLEDDVYIHRLIDVMILKGPDKTAMAQNLALDILNRIAYVRLCRRRSVNGSIEQDQVAFLWPIENRLSDLVKSCIIQAGRSTAKKCVKLVITCNEGAKNLLESHTPTFNDSVLDALNKCLPLVLHCTSSGAMRWYFLLMSHVLYFDRASEAAQKCINLLHPVAKELNKRCNPYHMLLRTRFGLYQTPLELELFDIEASSHTNSSDVYDEVESDDGSTSTGINFSYTAEGGPCDQMEIPQTAEYSGDIFGGSKTILGCWRKFSSSFYLKGFLEVIPLHFKYHSSSDFTKMEEVEKEEKSNGGTEPEEAGTAAAPDVGESTRISSSTYVKSPKSSPVTVKKGQLKRMLSEMKIPALIEPDINGPPDNEPGVDGQLGVNEPEVYDSDDESVSNEEDIIDDLGYSDSDFEELDYKVPDIMKPRDLSYIKDAYTLLGIAYPGSTESLTIQTDTTASDCYSSQSKKAVQTKDALEGIMNDEATDPVTSRLSNLQKQEVLGAESSSTALRWKEILSEPPQYTLVVERLQSAASRFIVLDFEQEILLTDVIIPSCPDLFALFIDTWCESENFDGQRLVIATDIRTKTLVMSDIQPPPHCRYLKITAVGRLRMTPKKCKIPLGSFYGHVLLLPGERPTNPEEDTSMNHRNIEIQLNALKLMNEDLLCQYNLSCMKLKELLSPYLTVDLPNIHHVYQYLKPTKEQEDLKSRESKIGSNLKVTVESLVKECAECQRKLNLIWHIVRRLQTGDGIKSSLPEDSNSVNSLELVPTDKLRVLSTCLLDFMLCLGHDLAPESRFAMCLSNHFDAGICHELFTWLCVNEDIYIQLATSILLVKVCGSQPWWSSFLTSIFTTLYTSKNMAIFPHDRIFTLITYMGRMALCSGTSVSLICSILVQLHDLMSPVNESGLSIFESDIDTRQIEWLLLFLSVCLDLKGDLSLFETIEGYKPECKFRVTHGRWDFIQGEETTKKNMRFKIRENFRRMAFEGLLSHSKQVSSGNHPNVGEFNINPYLGTTPNLRKVDIIPSCILHQRFVLPLARGLINFISKMDFSCNLDMFLLTIKVLGMVVSFTSPAMTLAQIMTEEQLLGFIRLAVWNDHHKTTWGLAWPFHAISCLLEEILENERLDVRRGVSRGQTSVVHESCNVNNLTDSSSTQTSVKEKIPNVVHLTDSSVKQASVMERSSNVADLQTTSSIGQIGQTSVTEESPNVNLVTNSSVGLISISEESLNVVDLLTSSSERQVSTIKECLNNEHDFSNNSGVQMSTKDKLMLVEHGDDPDSSGFKKSTVEEINIPPTLMESDHTFLNTSDDDQENRPIEFKRYQCKKSPSSSYIISSALDYRAEYGVEVGVDVTLKKIVSSRARHLSASLSSPIYAPESRTGMPSEVHLTEPPLLQTSENVTSETLQILTKVFETLFVELCMPNAWINLELLLQLWLNLNKILDPNPQAVPFFFGPSMVPSIVLSPSAVSGIICALTSLSGMSLGTWCLGFYSLTLLANLPLVDSGLQYSETVGDIENSLIGMAKIIIGDTKFLPMLLRFYGGSGVLSKHSSPLHTGPDVCQALHNFLVRLKMRCDVLSTNSRIMTFFKEQLLKLLYQLIQSSGPIVHHQGPLDAQCDLLDLLLCLDYSSIDLSIATNILESTGIIIYDFILNTQDVSCIKTIGNAPNETLCFSRDRKGTTTSQSSLGEPSAWNHVICSVLKLCSFLVRTPLNDPVSVGSLHADSSENSNRTSSQTEAVQPGSSQNCQTDEHKVAEQQSSNDGNIQGLTVENKVSCVADTVLQHSPTMMRLLISMAHCNTTASALEWGHAAMVSEPNRIEALGDHHEPITVGDHLFSLLVMLSEKASSHQLILKPLVTFLSTGGMTVSRPMKNLIGVTQLSEPLIWFLLRTLNSASALKDFSSMGGIKLLGQNVVKSKKSLPNAQPGLISTIVQQFSTASPNLPVFDFKETPDIVDGLINFAPLGCIVANSPIASNPEALIWMSPLPNPSRMAAWTHQFCGSEISVSLSITLPCAVLLKEVQLCSHLPALQSFPSAVAVKVRSARNSCYIPVCGPVATSGLPKLKLQFEPQVAITIVLRLYKPFDSNNIELDRIRLLGLTSFGNANIQHMAIEHAIEDSYSRSSLGWLRLLHHCINLPDPNSDLAKSALTSAAEVEGLLESFLEMFLISAPPAYAFMSKLESLLLRLGHHNEEFAVKEVEFLLRRGSALFAQGTGSVSKTGLYSSALESITHLLFELCAKKGAIFKRRINTVIAWLHAEAVQTTQNPLSPVSLWNPQAAIIHCVGSILWWVKESGLDSDISEFMTEEFFSVLYKWALLLPTVSSLKKAIDRVLCSICYINLNLFARLLQWLHVVRIKEICSTSSKSDVSMDHDSKQDSASISDDSKELTIGVDQPYECEKFGAWCTLTEDKNHKYFAVNESQLMTIGAVCQSDMAIHLLLDFELPKQLVDKIFEFCQHKLLLMESELNVRTQSTSESLMTDADKVNDLGNKTVPPGDTEDCKPLLTLDSVTIMLNFFTEVCNESVMKKWLGSPEGSKFWYPLMKLLYLKSSLSLELITEHERFEMNSYLELEAAYIKFLSKCCSCHSDNSGVLSEVLCKVLSKPWSFQQDVPSLHGVCRFIRQLMHQLFLRNEKLLVFLTSADNMAPLHDLWPHCAPNHPRFRNGHHHQLLYVCAQAGLGTIISRLQDGAPSNKTEIRLYHEVGMGEPLPEDMSFSQILYRIYSNDAPNQTYLHLKVVMSPKDNSGERIVSGLRVSLMSTPYLPTGFEVFAYRGGLTLLSLHFPVSSISSQTSASSDVHANRPVDQHGVESCDEPCKPLLSDRVFLGIQQALCTANLPVPTHSVLGFRIFLRLPGYAETLMIFWRSAADFLRLVLGFADDIAGVDIRNYGDKFILHILPFHMLRLLFRGSPLTTADGVYLRRNAIDVGAMDLILGFLSLLTHHSEHIYLPDSCNEPQVSKPSASSLLNIQDSYSKYWAKGTGFATGSTAPCWNMQKALLRQKHIDMHVTALLHVLASYIYSVQPGSSESLMPSQEKWRDYGPLPVTFLTMVQQSCLIPVLSAYLRNDSVLDMTRHTVLYQAVLELVRAIAHSPLLRTLLFPNPEVHGQKAADDSSLVQLVKRMYAYVKNYASQLKLDLNDKNSTTDSEDGVSGDREMSCLMEDLSFTLTIFEDLIENVLQEDQQLVSADKVVTCGMNASVLRTTEDLYLEVMKVLQFGSFDMIAEDSAGEYHFVVSYHFESDAQYSAERSRPSRTKRLAQEAVVLSSSLPISSSSTVFVRHDTSRLDVMKVLITGPAETPYANGCFEFDIFFPLDYPMSPMRVNFKTTGLGTVRFNPNLYPDGRVCLSVLNTWQGSPEERWNPQTSSFLQVLVSIQSLILVPEPYFNEPGYEISKGTNLGDLSSREYNAIIYNSTARWAMLEQVRNPCPCFREVIKNHFWLKQHEIVEQLNRWIQSLRTQATNTVRSSSNYILQRYLGELKKEFSLLRPPAGCEDIVFPETHFAGEEYQCQSTSGGETTTHAHQDFVDCADDDDHDNDDNPDPLAHIIEGKTPINDSDEDNL